MFNSTQSNEWTMEFNLERLVGQEITLAVGEFDFGFRLETVWWLGDVDDDM